jgi:hypothetical protein
VWDCRASSDAMFVIFAYYEEQIANHWIPHHQTEKTASRREI